MIKTKKNTLRIIFSFTVIVYLMLLSGCCGGPSSRPHRAPPSQGGEEDEETIVRYIGETFKYSGSLTGEADPIDVFSSTLPPSSVKTKISNYMEPFKPAQESADQVYYLSYPNSVIVVDPMPKQTGMKSTAMETDPSALSRIRVYPPEIAKKRYNSSRENVYVHEYYDPYYYHRHRNRYLSVHFRGHYGGYYRRHYGNRWGRMKPRYSGGYSRYRYGGRGSYRSRYKSRGYGSSRKSYSSSGFRGGGRSWGK